MINKSVRQIDIARALGLSRSTVAAVLRKRKDDPNYRIRPETEAKVLEMASSMNYSPSILGKSLRAQRTFLVGVLNSRVNFYYNSDVSAGMQGVFSDAEYAPVVYTHEHSLETEWRYLSLILDRQVEGLILNAAVEQNGATNNQKLQELRVSTKLPMVELFGNYIEGVPSVLFDYRALAQLAVQRLQEKGHTRIAFVVHDKTEVLSPDGRLICWTANAMLKGYLSAMQEAGLEPIIVQHSMPSSLTDPLRYYRAIAENADRTLNHPAKPTAVIAHNEENALALLMRQQESRALDDRIYCIAPSGVNPVTYSFRHAIPLQFPIADAGRVAADLLLKLIDDRNCMSGDEVVYIPPAG